MSLIRFCGSGLGHQPSGPLVSVKRVARPGMPMRANSMPVTEVPKATSFG